MSKLTVIFGGSFDPITKAHLAIARYVRDALDAKVILVPAVKNYKGTDITDFTIRYDLIKATIEEEKDIRVSTIEYDLYQKTGQVPKTIDTLRELKDDDLALLVGADNFIKLDRWYKSEEILRLAKPIVYPRAGIDIKTSPIFDKAIILSAPELKVSSSEIRDSGRADMLDEKTKAYLDLRPDIKAIYLS